MRNIKTITILLFLIAISLPLNSFTMSLVDKYRDIEIGDWVKLELTTGTIQLLFVADRDESSVTIEVRESDRGFIVSWHQIVIDSVQKRAVLIREKDPVSGTVIEREPLEDEGIDEVLRAEFIEVGTEKISQTMQVPSEDGKELVEKKTRFNCVKYKSVIKFDEKRYIEMWYANEIPLYPVKVNVPGLNTTVRLVRHGSGRVSRFLPPEEEKVEETKPEE